jgi:riboflavin synthase
MFTGIIEEAGTVRSNESGRMWIDCGFAYELKIGQSVACNGVCLTVVDIAENPENHHEKSRNGSFCVEMMSETVVRTDLGSMKAGFLINLERTLLATDRFDGHVVQGHVDTMVTLMAVSEKSNGDVVMKVLDIEVPGGLEKYIVEKGSIALDGISLTVSRVHRNVVSVSIIPHTWEVTNLSTKKVGCKFNLEVDVMAKHIEKLVICNR